MTPFQESQNIQANQEIKNRFHTRVAEFGPNFRDVIFVSPDKHGRSRVGFSCEFSGHQTYAYGKTALEFAKIHFPECRIVNHGSNYVVLNDAQRPM